MRAKHSTALLTSVALGLGLLSTACGPIAFTDSVRYAAPPPPPPEVKPERSHASLTSDHIVLDGKIQFGHDSAELNPRSYELLNDVVKLLRENPDITNIDIIGHTSTDGSARHNMELSASRAAAVELYLADKGIDLARLGSEGMGETEPIADESTDSGKEENRRVEFKILKQEEGGARGVPGS